MAKKNFGAFFENSLGDLGENSTIITKSNELESVLNSGAEKTDDNNIDVPSPIFSEKTQPVTIKKDTKDSSLKLRKEKIRENLPVGLRKILKKADAVNDEPNGSIRLNKEIIKELKISCIKFDVPAYKIVSILIQEFLEKNRD